MLMDRRELSGKDRDEANLPQIDVRLVGPEDIAKQLSETGKKLDPAKKWM